MNTASVNFTFTLDVEDHRAERSSSAVAKRYPQASRRLLQFLKQRNITATVFIVGEIIEDEPELLKEIVADGHELALHSMHHHTLDNETPASFLAETSHGKQALEQLTGHPVIGYRAPVFSLTPSTRWILEPLKEMGFKYSSSIIPTRSALYGFPGAPQQPFRWPNGLLELPAPVTRVGPLELPYLGGIYLRYLPTYLTLRGLRLAGAANATENHAASHSHSPRTPSSRGLWSYIHPYDIDNEEPLLRIKGTSWPVSLLLWLNRGGTLKKLGRVAEHFGAERCASFEQRLAAGEFDHLATFSQ
jgi:polysaccharide deacetylase family protein (PEP-CTERM system associated)